MSFRNYISKVVLLFSISVFVVDLQNANTQTVNDIRNYEIAKLENGLTLIKLPNEDSVNLFIRLYSDLPEYVSENYKAVHAVNKKIKQNSSIKLPGSWTLFFKPFGIEFVEDKFGYYLNCDVENIDTVFYFLSQYVQNPKFHKSDIEESKTFLNEESAKLKPLLKNKIDKITKSVLYGKEHSYTNLLNDVEISKVNEAKLLDFYNKFHKPNNTYIIVVGNISIDTLKPLVENAFNKWKKKPIPEAKYKLRKIEEPKILFIDTIPGGQRKISLTFPFSLFPFTFDAEKAELLSVLVQQILIRKLIEEKSLATEIQAGFHNDKITGNYQMDIWYEKDSINNLVNAIISVINDLKAGKFSKEDLEYSKKIIISDFESLGNSKIFLSGLILNTEIGNLAKNYYADFVRDINQFTGKQIQTFTEKYLSYNTSIFTISGKWYPSLHDIVKLSKDFRIELYNIDGTIRKVIPKGFNGFSVVNDYISAIGGRQKINKIKDLSVKISGIYEMNDQQVFINGEILHKHPKYLLDLYMIRPKKDTVFLHQQIYDGRIGYDSTMIRGKILENDELNILKFKSQLIPEISYKKWQFSSKIVKVDTLNGMYVYVVLFKNPAKQQMLDYYSVDNALRLKREIQDNAHLSKRTIVYDKYSKENEKEILYPYKQTISTENTIIRMIIRSIDYKSKIDKKRFNFPN